MQRVEDAAVADRPRSGAVLAWRWFEAMAITSSERGAHQLGPARLDGESRKWIDRLSSGGAERDEAVAALHTLLLGAARFEVGRRRAAFPHLRGDDLDDLAQQSADDAVVAILAKLGEFHGDSRFTTWAYKFALYEAAVKIRRRAWQGREIPLEPAGWDAIAAP